MISDDYKHPKSPFIGRCLNKNIYSSRKVLIQPEYSLISDHVLRKLEAHGVEITENDIESNDQTVIRVVDHVYSEMLNIFQDIRQTGQVMVDKIHKYITPVLRESVSAGGLVTFLLRLQGKDDVTCRHSIAVSLISTLLGRWLELEEDELARLSTAAMLHDIGKLKVPSSILNKPGKLTAEEFDEMKRHTIYGYEMLLDSGLPERSALVALEHHERSDGSGYPYGKQGEETDKLSRIVAVADVFHAMCSKRTYKKELPFYKVIGHMYHAAFGPFDGRIVTVFTYKIMESVIGSEIRLTNGKSGTIISMNPNDISNPLIKTENGYYNLSQIPELNIDCL